MTMLEFHLNSGNFPREPAGKIGHSENSSPSSSSASSGILLAPTCHQNDDPPSPSSPPLWSNASHPLRPTSARSQAIARGRWELMEMLKDVPESFYELSLKDLVESVGTREKDEQKEEEDHRDRGLITKKKKKRKRRTGGGWEQNYGNGGLLLKMFVPSSYLVSKPAAGSGKVSPRPLFMVEEKEGGGGDGDNWEWWRKGFRVVGLGKNSRSSSSGSSSSNRSSGSSASRYEDGFLPGCWSFLRHSRRKFSTE